MALPLQAGTKLPLLFLLLHRHLLVLPAPLPGQGIREEAPKKYRVNEDGLIARGGGSSGWEIKIHRTG